MLSPLGQLVLSPGFNNYPQSRSVHGAFAHRNLHIGRTMTACSPSQARVPKSTLTQAMRRRRAAMKQPTWKSLITAALGIAFLFSVVSFQSAAAQEYNILYRFRGGRDGYQPEGGLTLDAAGRLYGTEPFGGAHLHGSVFRLRHTQTRWVHDILYSFAAGNDGEGPIARVITGPDGNFYGTTSGGGGVGCGTVFKLAIPATARQFFLGDWKETVLHGFTNS